jgi:NAD(P)-dependent dehydrogenase (short-subunit alcohol dehydrogenase family)
MAAVDALPALRYTRATRMRTLHNRIAVVTGAAGGIGRATSVALAREGCDLAISDVNEPGVRETAALIEQVGRRACCHVVDVSDKSRMERYAQEVVGEYGAVHILVNNAGVTVASPFEEHSLEDWEWIVGINFWGVVYGCKFFLPHLKQADEAHIVNLSSVFGLLGVPAQSSYCATKFAVRGLSEALWVELKQHNIGVTAVHPAGVRTDIARAARTTQGDLKSSAGDSLERMSVSPERCATLIVRAIKRGKMRQLVAREAYLIEAAKRISPTLPQRLLQAGFSRGLGVKRG